jgi:4a-hydroxytetrahydrobiopterin dehydratase
MIIHNLPEDLTMGHCVPCEGGMMPIDTNSAQVLIKNIPEWNLDTNSLSIHREYKFPDFKTALDFVNKIGELAESEGHHPDIELSWGRVYIKLSTHAIGGLSGNDFILAAKIDMLS